MAVALALVFVLGVVLGRGTAEVHHVVGGNRGWAAPLDVAVWADGRVFRVGDKLWFAYSAAQESIAEVRTKEEYETCDHSNAIRKYTDGLESIMLLEEGIRYFVSTRTKSCNSGLKLHVDVKGPGTNGPTPRVARSEPLELTAGPTSPSVSHRVRGSFLILLGGFMLNCANVC